MAPHIRSVVLSYSPIHCSSLRFPSHCNLGRGIITHNIGIFVCQRCPQWTPPGTQVAHPTCVKVRILQSEAATIQWSSTSARFLHSRTLSIGERKTRYQRKGKYPCSDKPTILLTHFNDSKLCSQTQPGWGIQR